MDDFTFCWGFLSGFVVAGIFGFVLQRLRLASATARRAASRQPIRGETDQTPYEVVRQARAARLEMIAWIMLIILSAGCILIVLVQGG